MKIKTTFTVILIYINVNRIQILEIRYTQDKLKNCPITILKENYKKNPILSKTMAINYQNTLKKRNNL